MNYTEQNAELNPRDDFHGELAKLGLSFEEIGQLRLIAQPSVRNALIRLLFSLQLKQLRAATLEEGLTPKATGAILVSQGTNKLISAIRELFTLE